MMNEQVEIRVQGAAQEVGGVVSALQKTFDVLEVSPYRDLVPGNNLVRCTVIAEPGTPPAKPALEKLKAKRSAMRPKMLSVNEWWDGFCQRATARVLPNLGRLSLNQCAYHLARGLNLGGWRHLSPEARQAWREYAADLLVEVSNKQL